MNHNNRPLILATAALLFSCVVQAPSALADTFTALVDGQKFVATQVIAVRSTIAGKPVINVTGHMKTKVITSIGFNITGTSIGHYAIEPGSLKTTHGSYHVDVMDPDIMNVYSFRGGAVEITALDAKAALVSGTFAATATNSEGKSVAITNGVFKDIPLQDAAVPR